MAGGRFWALDNNCDTSESTGMNIDTTSGTSVEDVIASKLYRSLQDESAGNSGKKLPKKRANPNNKASKIETNLSPKEPMKVPETNLDPKAVTATVKSLSQKVLCYIKSDTGPFKVIIAMKSPNSQENLPKSPSVMEISRFLVKCGVRFSLLKNISRYKWVATFDNKSDANNSLDNKYLLESRYTASIPWYFLYRRMIIRGVPVDVSEEELWSELKISNPNHLFGRDDIYRMQRRSYVDGMVHYINTTSVKMSLRTTSIPSHVFAWKTRFEVAPYIPVIQQCYNCGQLNHSTKFCTNIPKCLTCGQDKHKAEVPCSNVPVFKLWGKTLFTGKGLP